MQTGSTNCYRISVNTTNGMRDTFNMNGTYYDCDDGHVYVMADTIEAAARCIPCAVAIERVGFGIAPSR